MRQSQHLRTPEVEQRIVELYNNGLSASKIRNELKLFKTDKSITDILKKYDIKIRDAEHSHRSIERNSNFFSKIETKEQAYILGLLITDGWISSLNTIGFSSSDKELTEIVSENIVGKTHYTIIKSKEHQILNHKCVNKEAYQFQLNDSLIKSDLINLGFQINKSFNEFLPYLQPHLMSHLIRGIFDGDGSIYILSNKIQPGINFYSGSQMFLKQIGVFLYITLGIKTPDIKSSQEIYKISYTRWDYTQILMNYLYQDSNNLRLLRKRAIWEMYEGKEF